MLYSFILACGVHRDDVLCPFMNNGNKNCIMIKSTYFQVTETVYHYPYKVFRKHNNTYKYKIMLTVMF